MTASASAAAFAAVTAIEDGEWDWNLQSIARSITRRLVLIDHTKPPRLTAEMIASGHQVWAWMNGLGTPHWEVRGTGAIVPEEMRRKS